MHQVAKVLEFQLEKELISIAQGPQLSAYVMV